jgi:hypothetical protein
VARQLEHAIRHSWPREHVLRQSEAADDLYPGAEQVRVAAHRTRQRGAEDAGGIGRRLGNAAGADRLHLGEPRAVAGDRGPWHWQAGTAWLQRAGDEASRGWIADVGRALAPWWAGETYPNFIVEPDRERLRAAYAPAL